MARPKKEIKEEVSDLKKYSAYEIFLNSPAGETMLEAISSEIEGAVDNLCSMYRDADPREIVAVIARIEALKNFVRTITNSPRDKATVLGFIDRQKKGSDNTEE